MLWGVYEIAIAKATDVSVIETRRGVGMRRVKCGVVRYKQKANVRCKILLGLKVGKCVYFCAC